MRENGGGIVVQLIPRQGGGKTSRKREERLSKTQDICNLQSHNERHNDTHKEKRGEICTPARVTVSSPRVTILHLLECRDIADFRCGVRWCREQTRVGTALFPRFLSFPSFCVLDCLSEWPNRHRIPPRARAARAARQQQRHHLPQQSPSPLAPRCPSAIRWRLG